MKISTNICEVFGDNIIFADEKKFDPNKVVEKACSIQWPPVANESEDLMAHITVQPTSVLTKATVWYEIGLIWANITYI